MGHLNLLFKKGELTTQQIVLLIILIASFIIILFFLFRLNPGQEVDSEACHESVVMRGNPVIPSDTIPLKCQTQYLCISQDGSCEGLTKPVLEKVKTKEDVYDALADEMANCWWMFGEGDINYVGKDFKQNFYCSICTQFVLDDSLRNINGINNGKIDEKDFYKYLETKKYDTDGTTYLEYLTGSKNLVALESILNSEGASFGTFDVGGQQYYIMMGIYSDVGVWKWVAGATIAAGIIAAPFTGGSSLGLSALLIGTSAAAGGIGGYYAGTAIKGQSGLDYLTPVILKANSQEFDAFKCKNIMTLS